MINVWVIRALETKNSIIYSLAFANNTILLRFFFFFFFDWLEFFIHAVNAHIFIPTAEIAIPTRTVNNKANAEIEANPLTAETKIRKPSKPFKNSAHFYMLSAHQAIVLFDHHIISCCIYWFAFAMHFPVRLFSYSHDVASFVRTFWKTYT